MTRHACPYAIGAGFGMRQQQAGPAHVHPLPYAQFQFPAPAQRCAQRRNGRRGAARGRVFRHAAGEHPRLDIGRGVDRVAAGVSGVNVDRLRPIQRQQRRVAVRIRRRTAQGVAAGQLRHQEYQPHRHHLRRMLGHLDVGRLQLQRARQIRGGDLAGARQRLRRLQLHAFHALGARPQGDAHQARSLFKNKGIRRRAPRRDHFARQHHRRTHIRMSRERHLAIRREYPYPGRIGAVFRRQHEAGFRVIEFAGNALHLRTIQPLGVQHDRQRVAAIGLRGEYIGRHVAVAHQRSLIGV
ncbi:hypothetical protein D3C73_824250 [compost metagenome]